MWKDSFSLLSSFVFFLFKLNFGDFKETKKIKGVQNHKLEGLKNWFDWLIAFQILNFEYVECRVLAGSIICLCVLFVRNIFARFLVDQKEKETGIITHLPGQFEE